MGMPESYVVLDLETTGLSAQNDRIIEIGALKVQGGEIQEKFQKLVNPEREIGGFITRLTGITNEMVADAPTIEEALPQFLEFAGDAVILGHNVGFDLRFVSAACERLYGRSFSNDFMDTMMISRRLFPQERHHRLLDLVIRFHIAETEEHRALSDALQTQACYRYMVQYMDGHGISMECVRAQGPRLPSYYGNKCSARDIVADDGAVVDETCECYGRVFVFTGTLAKLERKDAMQRVVNRGGICKDGVTMKTNYLVLGSNDNSMLIKDGKSTKQKKAEELRERGQDIRILSEQDFYALVGLDG
ncbi:MAG: 3'-5' exoribonuclease [Clostridia bacterium]|nr:3'-5' exoribonuclease [Clostridia bacterium]